jgi:hypothetical protein
VVHAFFSNRGTGWGIADVQSNFAAKLPPDFFPAGAEQLSQESHFYPPIEPYVCPWLYNTKFWTAIPEEVKIGMIGNRARRVEMAGLADQAALGARLPNLEPSEK